MSMLEMNEIFQKKERKKEMQQERKKCRQEP